MSRSSDLLRQLAAGRGGRRLLRLRGGVTDCPSSNRRSLRAFLTAARVYSKRTARPAYEA